MFKNIFIANPKSGNGKYEKFLNELIACAKEAKVDNFLWSTTSEKYHAIELAKYYSTKYPDSIIYSVGGDGTLNEVVNGINSNTKLAIIPTGTGNDFFRVYKDIKGTKKINIGAVNGIKFINMASVGIDAKIADTANKLKYSNQKILSYPRSIISEIINYNPDKLTINEDKSLTTLLTVCNGAYYGNGVPMNPNYDLNSDGFNVLHTPKLSRREIVILLLKIFKGTHLEDRKVKVYKSDNIIVESDKEIICNIDGEIIKGYDFEFKLVKDGITVTNDIPQYVKKAISSIK